MTTCIRLILLSALIFAFQNASALIAIPQWQVNSWGTEPPVASFWSKDSSCSRNGVASSTFEVLSRGNGDAEVTLPGVLTSNKAYKLNVWLYSSSSTRVDVFFRRDGFPYETTANRSVTVLGWTQVILSGIHASNAGGSVRIALHDDNIRLCINSASLIPITFSSVGSPVASNSIDASFFGIHLNRLGRHNSWPTFDPGTLRLWDTGTTWALLQPTSAPIDWENNPYAQRLDYYVRHGISNHPGIQFIYTLGMTPSWAGSKHPTNCNASFYGPSICTKPQDIESWRQHVRELGLRYKGVIRVWEVWNEADVWVHWDNKPEDMVPLVKVASEELKKIDPNNKIIGPNVTMFGLGFLNRFLAAGGSAYIDGISIHAYLGRSPELSLASLRNLRQMLTEQGIGNMPIWNTETGVSCIAQLEDCAPIQAGSPSVLNGEDALAQGLIVNAAFGVANFSYYTWEGSIIKYGNLALVENDYQTPTKAGLVYSNIRAWLTGANLSYQTANTGGLNVVKVQRGGVTSFVLWSSGAPVMYHLTGQLVVNRYMLAGGSSFNLLLSRQLKVGAEPILLSSSSLAFNLPN